VSKIYEGNFICGYSLKLALWFITKIIKGEIDVKRKYQLIFQK
jgi:hypothetical protein